MTFWLYSVGYFTNIPRKDHIAVSLRGSYDYVTSPHGRGVIFGAVIDHPQGCSAGAPSWTARAQIESYQTATLWNNTCTPSGLLQDGVLYGVTIHAIDVGWVSYSIHDYTWQVIYQSPSIQDPNYVAPNSLGWWIANVEYEARNWELYFSEIETGWF